MQGWARDRGLAWVASFGEKVSPGVAKLVSLQPENKGNVEKAEPRASILVIVREFLDHQHLTLFNPVGK